MSQMPPVVYTDGCTGFPEQLGQWNWTTCCTVHDSGGTDLALLKCLQDSGPDWAGWLFAAAVVIMVAFRPVYVALQRMGLLKGLDNPVHCYCGVGDKHPSALHHSKCRYATVRNLPQEME